MKLTQKTWILRIYTGCQSRDANSPWWHLEHECMKYLLRLEETKNRPWREHFHRLAMLWRLKSQEAGPTCQPPQFITNSRFSNATDELNSHRAVPSPGPLTSSTVLTPFHLSWSNVAPTLTLSINTNFSLVCACGTGVQPRALCPLSTCYYRAIPSTHKSFTSIDNEACDLLNKQLYFFLVFQLFKEKKAGPHTLCLVIPKPTEFTHKWERAWWRQFLKTRLPNWIW